MQPVIGPRPAIMLLVGMQHDHLPRQAEAPLATIGKCLHALERHPKRISIVTMRLEGVSGEVRFDTLDAWKGRRGDDPRCNRTMCDRTGRNGAPVHARLRAQTFKTLKGVMA